MLADEIKAGRLVYRLLRLRQTPADSADDAYQRVEAAGLLLQTSYLGTAAEPTESPRNTAHKLQRQTFAVIDMKPSLAQRTVTRDIGLHLLVLE